MTKTEQKLAEMLTENTGRHMLDSGGAYGRHWERNQERKFEDEPATNFTADKYGIEVTHNLYHWLSERLEFDEKMNKLWEDFCDTPEQEDLYWYENKENFLTEHLTHIGYDIDVERIEGINTYNGEDMLSQTIQYNIFECDNVQYVMLEIHQGCDVRGGYTAPVIFEVLEDRALWGNARATISCDRSDIDPNQLIIPGVERDEDRHFWDTEDGGYSWCDEGNWNSRNSTNLETYKISKDEDARGKGKIYVDGNGKIFCPICGSLFSAWG